MIPLAFTALTALILSVMLALSGLWPNVAVWHLAFAVGLMPLIFAAMSHFVPVLTRTGKPEPLIRRLPWLAQATGLLVPLVMAAWVPRHALYPVAAVDLVLAAILLRWILGRRRACLGAPHPGWCWYAAALSCLLLALLVVLLMAFLPSFYPQLRLLHLHLNTLGLVGLAGLGTLPVLLPTAMGKFDPQAADWLRRQLPFALAGVLFLGLGLLLNAGRGPLLVLAGMLWLWVACSLLHRWLLFYGHVQIFRSGAAASLAASLLGLCSILGLGLLHGSGLANGGMTLQLWGLSFLLPMVTGALSQLLPVWRWPGVSSPAHGRMRDKLMATGGWRGLLFLLAGLALGVGVPVLAGLSLALAMLLFVLAVVQAMGVARSTR